MGVAARRGRWPPASIIYALVLILGGASIFSEAITIVLYGAVLYYLNQPGIKSLFGRA